MTSPRIARTALLDICYLEHGPADGHPVVLLHRYPLQRPHLRGHRPTSFLRKDTIRSGQPAQRREIAEVIWRRNSPEWDFAAETFDAVAEADGNFPVSVGLPDADVFTGPRAHRRSREPVTTCPRGSGGIRTGQPRCPSARVRVDL